MTLTFLLSFIFLLSRFYHADGLWFPINTVKVEGRYQHVSRKEVADVLSPYLKDGFWGISLAHVGKQLRDNGWVKKAHLERVWPDTLRVKIEEHEPWLRFGQNTLIDKEGNLFSLPQEKIPNSIPLLRSETGLTKDLLQEFEKISKILSEAHIVLVELYKGRTTLKLNTKTGMQLVTSSQTFLDELQRFVDVYPTITQEKKAQIVRIDLRYRHGMAVQWK